MSANAEPESIIYVNINSRIKFKFKHKFHCFANGEILEIGKYYQNVLASLINNFREKVVLPSLNLNSGEGIAFLSFTSK